MNIGRFLGRATVAILLASVGMFGLACTDSKPPTRKAAPMAMAGCDNCVCPITGEYFQNDTAPAKRQYQGLTLRFATPAAACQWDRLSECDKQAAYQRVRLAQRGPPPTRWKGTAKPGAYAM